VLNEWLQQAVWFERSRDHPGRALATVARWLRSTVSPSREQTAYAQFLRGRILCRQGKEKCTAGLAALSAAEEAASGMPEPQRQRFRARLAVERLYALFQTGDTLAAEAEAEDLLKVALAGEAPGVASAAAHARFILARVHHARGDTRAARMLLQQAYDAFRRSCQAWGLARVYDGIGQLLEDSGHCGRAERFYRTSLRIKQGIEDNAGQAITQGNLGRLYLRRYDLPAAEEAFRQDLALSRRLGDRTSQAIMANHIGRVLRKRAVMGQAFGGSPANDLLASASTHHRRSLELVQDVVNDCHARQGLMLAAAAGPPDVEATTALRQDLHDLLAPLGSESELGRYMAATALLAEGMQLRRAHDPARAVKPLEEACIALAGTEDYLEGLLELVQAQWQAKQVGAAWDTLRRIEETTQRYRAFAFAETLATQLAQKAPELCNALTLAGNGGAGEPERGLASTWMHFVHEAETFDQRERYRQRTEVLEDEIDRTADVVRDLLPRKLPRVAGLDMFGLVIPFDRVGGDQFQIQRRSEEPSILDIAVADAEGHGLSAAPLMAMFRAAWQAHLPGTTTVAELAQRLSRTLGDTGVFKGWASFLGRIDCRDWQLEYFLAADTIALLCRGGDVTRLKADMSWVGRDSFRCEERRLQLELGDVLFILTDGTWMGLFAADCSGAVDPLAELREVVREAIARSHDAKSMAEAVFSADRIRRSMAAAPDDATVVVLRRTDESSDAENARPPGAGQTCGPNL